MSQMKRRTVTTFTALALAGMLSVSSCTGSKDFDALQSRVYSLEQRVNSLEENRATQAQMGAEMDVMRAEINTLRGKVDGFERRFKAPSVDSLAPGYVPPVGANATSEVSTQPVETIANTAPALVQPALQPSDATQQPAIPRNTIVVSEEANTTDPAKPASQVVPGSDPSQAEAVSPPSANSGDPAQAAYNEARAQFNAQNYEAAQAMWSNFVSQYPNNELAPNAIFWQGEALFQLKQYPKAILAYQEVISKHANSPKIAAAYLKQGIAFIQIGKEKAGQVQLQHVIHKYPNSPESARAMEYLKRAN